MEFLSVTGNQIVDAKGDRVRLRGTCPGGWMNMEDFINGYPGAEHTLRTEMKSVLGAAKAEFFFDRLLDHFLNESDVIYLKRMGATVVRLPLNFRHFEDESAPFQYNEKGFTRLSQVLKWCERHGLYAILDLHAVAGWQNVHWHSDNASRVNLFWESAHYQDRFIALWRELARRFGGEAVVAGYNLMNEPCVNNYRGDLPWNIYRNYQPDWPRFNALYKRAVTAVREIDPKHIIFLEGDYYSHLFAGMDVPFADNLVYSSHNYTSCGFGPGPYPGVIRSQSARTEGLSEYWDLARQERAFLDHEGTVFTQQHGVPLWVGEFGSAYNGATEEIPDRLRAMDDQISILERYAAHWTTWNYKDVGVMGMLTVDPASPYMQLVGDLVRKKEMIGTDDWMHWLPMTPVKEAAVQLADQIRAIIGDEEQSQAYTRRCLSQNLMCFFVGGLMQPAYAKLFKELSESQIDHILMSFSCEQCKPNEALTNILRRYMAYPV